MLLETGRQNAYVYLRVPLIMTTRPISFGEKKPAVWSHLSMLMRKMTFPPAIT